MSALRDRPCRETGVYVIEDAPSPSVVGLVSRGAKAPEPNVRAGGSGSDSLLVVYSHDAALLHTRFVLDNAGMRVGRDADNQIVLKGDSASRHHARFERRDNAWWVVDAGSTNGTFVNDEQAWSARRLRNGDRVKVGATVLEYVGGPDLEAQYLEAICQTTEFEALTQARTRRCLFEALEKEVVRAKGNLSALSFMLVGIDHFKELNNFHGEMAGDVVLRELARLLHASVRSGELLARYDGDELALMLPETPLAGGCARAEGLRQDIEHAEFLFQGEAIPVTVSIGVALLTPGLHTAAALVRAAAERLAEAKSVGRNRVVS